MKMRSRSRKMQVELLDQRALLAGDCGVIVNDGVVDIKCDRFDNIVNISGFGGAMLISGNGGTTFNGLPQIIVSEPVTELNINTKNGDDAVLVSGSVADRVNIKTGQGNDDVILGFVAASEVAVDTGQGNDNIGALGVNAADVVLASGSGHDCISANFVTADTLELDAGSGNDIGGTANSFVDTLIETGIEVYDPFCGV